MTLRASDVKNIWIAAGDGDLARVTDLVENSGISPNVADENTYTPMHAAASYNQREVLVYLLSKGGDMNVTDEEGDTPLYTVESIETAAWLIEHGADPAHKNLEGVSPSQHLQEDFPAVAAYLRTLTGEPAPEPSSDDELPEGDEDEDAEMLGADLSSDQLSSLMAERLTEEQTGELMQKFQEVMARCAEDGTDPDEELKKLVEETIFNTMDAGKRIGEEQAEMDGMAAASAVDSPSASKRARHQPNR